MGLEKFKEDLVVFHWLAKLLIWMFREKEKTPACPICGYVSYKEFEEYDYWVCGDCGKTFSQKDMKDYIIGTANKIVCWILFKILRYDNVYYESDGVVEKWK